MRKISILLVLLFTGSMVYSQDYRQEADKCLVAGDYNCAKRNLLLYHEQVGKNVDQEVQIVEICLKARLLADAYFEENENEKAAQQYDKILKLNPKDSYAKKQYDLCIAQSKPPVNVADNQNDIELVYVKGGIFTMGCGSEQGKDCDDDEKPAHQVSLSDFYIGKYEVTQAQWKAIMDNNPSHFKGDSLPVEQVSWNEVQEFIRNLNTQTGKNYRLPTEAEWEYVGRSGVHSGQYKYSGSNTAGNVAWYGENSGEQTHPVGQKSPNELGIYDMSGNVWEWCSDRYDNYSSNTQTNPTGASTGLSRVSRGGSWSNSAQSVRVSYRVGSSPGYRYYGLGFRLASDSN
ncbi:MAG: formylglycine-generating enzyme family protein [Dysgonamonadaceae bacterium]|jgi:formylglycine-generating enzyme required for sulfatase activity|nr:formylglycine-generating enzyme family protein [Dysgonamonadaceae bacterium]